MPPRPTWYEPDTGPRGSVTAPNHSSFGTACRVAAKGQAGTCGLPCRNGQRSHRLSPTAAKDRRLRVLIAPTSNPHLGETTGCTNVPTEPIRVGWSLPYRGSGAVADAARSTHSSIIQANVPFTTTEEVGIPPCGLARPAEREERNVSSSKESLRSDGLQWIDLSRPQGW